MAGGSAADPLIVSTWAELATAINQYVRYVKFADSDNKNLGDVEINQKIEGYTLQVDFNGYTIENLIISNVQSEAIDYIRYAANLTINHMTVYKSAYHHQPIAMYMYHCYLYDIYFESHDTEYEGFATEPVGIPSGAYCCILRMRSQDYAPRVPVLLATSSEISVNYKWTKTGAGQYHLIFGGGSRSAHSDEPYFRNCYITGTLDISEGTGTWYWSSFGNVSTSDRTYIDAGTCIFNINTIKSSSCSYDNICIQSPYIATATTWEEVPEKSLVVMNNGNSLVDYMTKLRSAVLVWVGSEAANVVKTRVNQITNKEWLTTRCFDMVDDDNFRDVRYVQDFDYETYQVPHYTWRFSEYLNGGVPFLPFYDMPIYEPPVIYPVERADRISVYDIYEPASGFDHNGVAVLFPSEVTSYKEDKGRWDINLTHPIDQYGKWTYIVGQNCIKVNGQIFRIDETEIYCDANQQYVKAHANHITYDLNDKFIGDAQFTSYTGTAYCAQLLIEAGNLIPTQQPTPYEYGFEIVSDISGQLQADVHDQTITGALYGDDNSLANRYGGQLYRDNFHISINTTMENIPATPAFQIRYGTDMTKISYKIDFSSWITELVCEDNFGDVWAVAYVGSEWIIHHNKTKRIHFTYPPDTPDPYSCLEADGNNYWATVSTPKVSVEVSVTNIKSDPRYQDFLKLQDMDVGYTGTVYFEQLGIDLDLRIVSIKRNELTGEAIQITLGNAPSSFIRSPVCSQTIVPNGSVEAKQQATMKAMQTEIENVKLKAMSIWSGIRLYTWADSKKYKWGEIKHGISNS